MPRRMNVGETARPTDAALTAVIPTTAASMERPRKRVRQHSISEGHDEVVDAGRSINKKLKAQPTTNNTLSESASTRSHTRAQPFESLTEDLSDDDDSGSDWSDSELNDDDDDNDVKPTKATRPTSASAHPPHLRPSPNATHPESSIAPTADIEDDEKGDSDASEYEESVYGDTLETASTRTEPQTPTLPVVSQPLSRRTAYNACLPTSAVLSAISTTSTGRGQLGSNRHAASSTRQQTSSTRDAVIRQLREQLRQMRDKIDDLEDIVHDQDATISSQEEQLEAQQETIAVQQETIEAAEDKLGIQEEKLKSLEASYERDKDSHNRYQKAYMEDNVRMVHEKEDLMMKSQNMMLDVVKRQTSHQQAVYRAAKVEAAQKRTIEDLVRKAEEHEKLLQEAKDQYAKQAKYVGEQKALRQKLENTVHVLDQELQSCQSWVNTLEGDISELRQLHEEDNGHKERHRQGLPPAYGSLDQRDLPWWIKHDDAGPLELSNWETKVRTNHAENMRRIYEICLERRPQGEGEVMRCIFIYGFEGIKAACHSLREFMTKIGDIHMVRSYEFSVEDPNGGPSKRRTAKRIAKKRELAPRALVGEIVVKLILELPWDLISANEVGGCSANVVALSAGEKAVLELAYHEMDEVLLEGLRHAFSGTRDPSTLEYEVYRYQRWSTAAEFVNGGLSESFGADISPKTFGKSKEWLAEQMEAARVVAAAARDAVGPPVHVAAV